jgi:hypothetical protein
MLAGRPPYGRTAQSSGRMICVAAFLSLPGLAGRCGMLPGRPPRAQLPQNMFFTELEYFAFWLVLWPLYPYIDYHHLSIMIIYT